MIFELDIHGELARLKSRLRVQPQDHEAAQRLGSLLEIAGGNPNSAAKYYLRAHLGRLGFADVAAATAALQATLQQTSDQPHVHLQLGEILARTGREDAAGRHFKLGTRWAASREEGFLIHYVPGTLAQVQKEEIFGERRAARRKIAEVFELPAQPAAEFIYYFYESRLHKRFVTGDGMPAHAFPRTAEIHAVHGPEYQLEGCHEEIHLLLRRLGKPAKMLQEGAAVYGDQGKLLEFWRKLARVPDRPRVAELLKDEAFLAANPYLAYSVAGLFTAYLIEAFGLDTYKRLYGSGGSQGAAVYAGLFGADPDGLERAMWAWVKSGIPGPS